MAKEKDKKKRPEHYEKSNLAIKGTFDEAMGVFFVKDTKQKKKEEK